MRVDGSREEAKIIQDKSGSTNDQNGQVPLFFALKITVRWLMLYTFFGGNLDLPQNKKVCCDLQKNANQLYLHAKYKIQNLCLFLKWPNLVV